MELGTIIGGRYEVEQLAGTGGTGVVYRAFDRTLDKRVALKLLHAIEQRQVQRFQREAQLLAELEHPGFVRYVGHGVTGGRPFLAMEWLEGEDLQTRLERGPLGVSDAIVLMTQVASAMGLAHQRGIVHRDIKPANLWLTDSQVAKTKVLDLGLARSVARAKLALSRTGAVMGTPGYMAPEQARGSPDLDVRADVFSLGCVMYECLTGQPTFTGEHLTAILAKILFEDAPRVSGLCPDVPPALDQLVRSMLSRRPAERPSDANAIVAELSRIECADGRQFSRRPLALVQPSPVLTNKEQEVLCVFIAGRADAPTGATQTLVTHHISPAHEAMRSLAEQHGARLEVLINGCVVATFASAGDATDLAAQAARCALALRPLVAGSSMALATGRGLVGEALPVGEAVERAARIMAHAKPGEIRLDDISAGLLDARFRLDRGRLVGERELPGGERLLLGKQTACVGRDWELATLSAAFSECVEAASPRVALVTAPAGVGKSRLRHEFLSRQQSGETQIWIGLGDPMRAGARLGLLAQAVRWAVGINGAVPQAMQRQMLRGRVERVVPSADVVRVTEFLGELVGATFSDDNSVALRAARLDPMLMADQMLRAFEDWLGAEAAAQPVILVFEDVHWGDLSSIKFVDAALRKLSDRAIFVLAMGRPEVHEKFPRLWAERGAVEINLRPLSRKPCESLVRQVLGKDINPELVARIVERAEGNAFYLEELIRTVAEGGEFLPASVITMLQLRLAALPDHLRLVLRAGSIFGGVFYGGAVASLLGAPHSQDLERHLTELVEREWIGRGRGSRFAGETSFTFRHDLVREAAYATLTEADRVLGHRLAAEWLERFGETEAIVVAEHFKRGGDNPRAAHWFQRAAEQAMEGNDLQSAILRAERAIECGASGRTLGQLRVLQAEAHNWRGEWEEAQHCGAEAMRLLEPSTALWAHAIHQTFWASASQGNTENDVLIEQLMAASSSEPLSRLHAMAHSNIASHLFFMSKKQQALRVLEPLRAVPHLAGDPAVAGSVAQVFARRELMLGNLVRSLAYYRESIVQFEAAGDARQVCIGLSNEGWLLAQLGNYVQAERVQRDAAATAKRLGLGSLHAGALIELGFTLAHLNRHHEGMALARDGISVLAAHYNPAQDTVAKLLLSRLHYLMHDFEAAAHEAERALEHALEFPTLRVKVLAARAQALISLGRSLDAVAAAKEAREVLDDMGGDDWEAFIRLIHAEALYATGETVAAHDAIRTARELLLGRARLIDSAEDRHGFLHNVPENARTLQVASEWLPSEPLQLASAG